MDELEFLQLMKQTKLDVASLEDSRTKIVAERITAMIEYLWRELLELQDSMDE